MMQFTKQESADKGGGQCHTCDFHPCDRSLKPKVTNFFQPQPKQNFVLKPDMMNAELVL